MSASTNSWSLPAHDAEVRLERGERVVGDLGLGRAHRGDQRRLARVREADERGVGQQLQLEPQPALLAVLALLGEARRAPRVRQEARVAAPALPAARREPAVAVAHEVGEQLVVGRRHDRALGHVDDEVVAALAVLLLARAVRARAGLAVRVVAEREQRRARCGWPAARRRRRSPPSPPSGPPLGTCASRRNATQPAPPSPPFTLHCATSTKPGHPDRIRSRPP